jgi:uncharacterized protein YbbC (DUF1343 family)
MAAPVCAQRAAGGVVPGIEVLLSDSLSLIQGKRVGLITNQSGRDRAGHSDIDLLYRTPGVTLVALFAPEHGIRGAAEAGERVTSDTDRTTGLPVYSLYGDVHAPTPAMLDRLDVLVYDIQDAGARVYTYEWTMALSAEAAGRAHKPFIVLDRPDPIRGDRIEGGVLDTTYRSFVGQYPVALRYGLTPGELLRYLTGTAQVHADAHVVPMKGWTRRMWYDQTELPWVNPSPNLRSVDALALYPGTVLFEGTNLSEGRGTDTPFQLIGAPWLTDAGAIAAELNALSLGGVRFDSTSRPIGDTEKYRGQTIPMLEVVVTDRDRVRPVDVAVRMMHAVYRRHAHDFRWNVPQIDRLAGTATLRTAVESAEGVDRYLSTLDAQSRAFQLGSARFRIYEP